MFWSPRLVMNEWYFVNAETIIVASNYIISLTENLTLEKAFCRPVIYQTAFIWSPGSARASWGSLTGTAPSDPLAAIQNLLLRGGERREGSGETGPTYTLFYAMLLAHHKRWQLLVSWQEQLLRTTSRSVWYSSSYTAELQCLHCRYHNKSQLLANKNSPKLSVAQFAFE